eukprot:scaffold53356_cov65-Phaeocystis_antarctica.AAC.3
MSIKRLSEEWRPPCVPKGHILHNYAALSPTAGLQHTLATASFGMSMQVLSIPALHPCRPGSVTSRSSS